jgi:hypothetical protein
MADFSDDILDKFRDYQKKKGQSIRNRVGQAVGGGAETIRTGRSAAATFADRAPDYGTMTAREKRAESAPIIARLGQEEQFYAGEALQERLTHFKEQIANARAVLQAAVQTRGQDVTASAARERQEAVAQGVKYGDLAGKINGLTDASPTTTAAVKGAARAAELAVDQHIARVAQGKYSDAVAAAGGIAQVSPTEQRRMQKEATLQAEQDSVADIQAIREGATKRAVAQLIADAAEEGITLDEADRRQGQAVVAGQLLVSEMEVNPAVLSGVTGYVKANDATNKAIGKTLEESDALVEKMQSINIGGSGGPVAEAIERMGAAHQQFQSTYAPGGAMAPQQGIPDIDQEPVQGPEGDAQGIEGYQTFMGLQGITPATDSRARSLQLLQAIEDHPEHPPLIEARNKILASPEFAAYKSKNNYRTDDVAFRLMKREMRQRNRDDKLADLEQVREDVTSGRLSRPGQIRQPDKPRAPVQGSTGRPAEDKSGGTERP